MSTQREKNKLISTNILYIVTHLYFTSSAFETSIKGRRILASESNFMRQLRSRLAKWLQCSYD